MPDLSLVSLRLSAETFAFQNSGTETLETLLNILKSDSYDIVVFTNETWLAYQVLCESFSFADLISLSNTAQALSGAAFTAPSPDDPPLIVGASGRAFPIVEVITATNGRIFVCGL